MIHDTERASRLFERMSRNSTIKSEAIMDAKYIGTPYFIK